MKFSKIDNSLLIYKNKKVIIWGTASGGTDIYHLLKAIDVNIIAFCDNNSKVWGKKLFGLDIISPNDLFQNFDNDMLIQIGSFFDREIEEQLLNAGITDYILYGEAYPRLTTIGKYTLFQEKPELYDYYLKEVFLPNIPQKDMWEKIMGLGSQNREECICLCMPPKTGDYTILHTAEMAGNGYNIINAWHSAYHIGKLLTFFGDRKRIKLVTAVREPISQNLSYLFQYVDKHCWERTEYWNGGGDVQVLFEQFIQENVLEPEKAYHTIFERTKELKQCTVAIQNFFEKEFEERLGICLYDYPFDKERGYSIIDVNGIEIFIYQIEKLNEIYKELFQFLNIDTSAKLIPGNEAKSKYYYRYYLEAQKEITISHQYFDFCYHTEYVNHFYSKEDIQKFKEKWRNHITS